MQVVVDWQARKKVKNAVVLGLNSAIIRKVVQIVLLHTTALEYLTDVNAWVEVVLKSPVLNSKSSFLDYLKKYV